MIALFSKMKPGSWWNNVVGAIRRGLWKEIEDGEDADSVSSTDRKKFCPLDETVADRKDGRANEDAGSKNDVIGCGTTVIAVPLWLPTTEGMAFGLIIRMTSKKDTPIFPCE